MEYFPKGIQFLVWTLWRRRVLSIFKQARRLWISSLLKKLVALFALIERMLVLTRFELYAYLVGCQLRLVETSCRLMRGKYQLPYVSVLQTFNFQWFVCFNQWCEDLTMWQNLCFMLIDIEQVFMYSPGRGMHRVSYIRICWRRSRWHKKGL